MVKASGRKKRRFLPEKAEGKQLEATNSESGKMHHRTPWLTADPMTFYIFNYELILVIYLIIKLGLCSRQISLSFSNCIIYFIVIVSKL